LIVALKLVSSSSATISLVSLIANCKFLPASSNEETSALIVYTALLLALIKSLSKDIVISLPLTSTLLETTLESL
jgi:hypothetical protein